MLDEMNLHSQRKFATALEKLRLLERLRADAGADTSGDSEVRDAEIESLQRQIERLKQQIDDSHRQKAPAGVRNIKELRNTEEKMRRLEARYEELRQDDREDSHVRELSMESLKAMINQFKEEIARFHARQPAASDTPRI